MMRSVRFSGGPWREILAVGLVVLALSVGLVSGAGAATRFVATSGNDSANACLASGSPCKTITHALTQAVANDTVSIAAGTYHLALGETFPLTINTNLTLTGAGAGSTILDATGANQRVITAAGADFPAQLLTVTIAGVTITGGHESCTSSEISLGCVAVGGGFGGGIITLTNSTVSGNTVSCTASEGGSCRAVGGGFGGGIITLTNSTVSGNTVSCTASEGGSCRAVGGGLSSGSGFSGNIVTLTNSTVSGNTASCSASEWGCGFGGGANGGGINFSGGIVTLTNSTVSGNTVSCTPSEWGCIASGGGISFDGDSLTLTNATITANTITCTGVAPCPTSGGGLYGDGTTTLQNTIVAKQVTGSDCSTSGTLTSNSFNLDSDNTCHLTQPSDKPNVSNPLLGPLADNGGPTQTHALLPGSPAIDAGTNTGCPSTDQRGITRPQGSACDIGAFEFVSTSSPGPTGPANARQLLNVATFVGPTTPPSPQQQQQTFRTIDPIVAGATYYDPNEACRDTPPAAVKLFVFTLEGQLVLGRNRETGGVTSTQIGTSKYQALLATLEPGALPAGSYNLVFWVKDCTDTAVLVSEFVALRVLSP